MSTSDLTKISEDLMQRLDGMINGDLFQHDDLYSGGYSNDAASNMTLDNVIIMHMDIREPLRTLQKLLERKLNIQLNGYEFWLQDAQELEPHKNLVDQCVKGEGLVQINVEIKYIENRINILDVLKPTDDALEAIANDECYKSEDSADQSNDSEEEVPMKKARRDKISNRKQDKPCLNWVLDNNFRKEQMKYEIPNDPNEWIPEHVRFWFEWAINEFKLENTNISDWMMTGRQLCQLTHEQFSKKIPKDPGNVFWTHIQLLKECKFVAVVHNAIDAELNGNFEGSLPTKREPKIMRKSNPKNGENGGTNEVTHTYSNCGIGSGNNGQVQLWQFLLEILTDRKNVKIIQWVGQDGEFKLVDPERVARLWGEKKKKPAMNYEKLSRALRYYYDGDMISKVTGKRFTYKFDCDLKLLIGYNAAELAQLVGEDTGLQKSIDLQKHDEELQIATDSLKQFLLATSE